MNLSVYSEDSRVFIQNSSSRSNITWIMNDSSDAHIALQCNFAVLNGEEAFARTRKELIQKYEAIVYDYLAIMNSSETVKTMDCQKYTVQLGLSAITHIYKLAFCTTKNVSTSADHCHKGIYCFIEYIEQTYKLGHMNAHAIDYMDAVVFIYDKTISELRNSDSTSIDEQSGSSSAFTNILSVSQSHQAHGIDFAECKAALDCFGRVASILWFSHSKFTIEDQMNIVDVHLMDFLIYAIDSSKLPSNDLFLFIETVQETITNMEKQEYMDFLVAIKKQIKRQMKNAKRSEDSGSPIQLNATIFPACLYVKTFSSTYLNEIAEQEKWKRGADDLAKIAFHCGE